MSNSRVRKSIPLGVSVFPTSSPSYWILLSLLQIGLRLSRAEFLYPTISPGQSIQKALDSLESRIGSLEENQYRSQEIQIRLLTIGSNNTSNIRLLSQGTNYFEAKMTKMDSSLKSLWEGQVGFDTITNSLNSRLDSLDKEIESSLFHLKNSIDKLEKLNKVWKNNFKIVSNTFKELKAKN